MAELDCAEEDKATATFSNGANARTGTIPVTYDAERKKMTWYYFMAASMTVAEMVCCLALSSPTSSCDASQMSCCVRFMCTEMDEHQYTTVC